MLQDLIPIVVDFPKGKDISIKAIGDLHIGSKQFSEERWKKWKTDLGDSYIVVVGDCIDNGIIHSVGMYDQTMMPSAQKEWLYEELKPYAEEGRILCGCGGNHEKRSKKQTDTDPLYDVFCRMKIEDRYRPSMAFCFLRIGGADHKNLTSKYRPSYCMLVTHGNGGGQMIGAGLNRVQRYGSVIEGLDLMISGHTHRPATFPSGKLIMDMRNKAILERQFVSVVVSSMMDYGGYPLDAMLTPTGHTDTEIILSAYKKNIKVIQTS